MPPFSNPPILHGDPTDDDVPAFDAALGEWVPRPRGAGGGGSQSPWTGDVDAADHKLTDLDELWFAFGAKLTESQDGGGLGLYDHTSPANGHARLLTAWDEAASGDVTYAMIGTYRVGSSAANDKTGETYLNATDGATGHDHYVDLYAQAGPTSRLSSLDLGDYDGGHPGLYVRHDAAAAKNYIDGLDEIDWSNGLDLVVSAATPFEGTPGVMFGDPAGLLDVDFYMGSGDWLGLTDPYAIVDLNTIADYSGGFPAGFIFVNLGGDGEGGGLDVDVWHRSVRALVAWNKPGAATRTEMFADDVNTGLKFEQADATLPTLYAKQATTSYGMPGLELDATPGQVGGYEVRQGAGSAAHSSAADMLVDHDGSYVEMQGWGPVDATDYYDAFVYAQPTAGKSIMSVGAITAAGRSGIDVVAPKSAPPYLVFSEGNGLVAIPHLSAMQALPWDGFPGLALAHASDPLALNSSEFLVGSGGWATRTGTYAFVDMAASAEDGFTELDVMYADALVSAGATLASGGPTGFTAGVTAAFGSADIGFYIDLFDGVAHLHASDGLKVDASLFAVYSADPVAQHAAIVDADGTLADLTAKFNVLLAAQRGYGFVAV